MIRLDEPRRVWVRVKDDLVTHLNRLRVVPDRANYGSAMNGIGNKVRLLQVFPH